MCERSVPCLLWPQKELSRVDRVAQSSRADQRPGQGEGDEGPSAGCRALSAACGVGRTWQPAPSCLPRRPRSAL